MVRSENPLAIESFTNVSKVLVYTIAPAVLGAVTLAVLLRLHRAVGPERQQIKWFAFAAAANVIATNLAYGVPGLIDTPLWFDRVGFALNIATIPAIPVAIGIAILRYRLYDIDRIINRTLVYGLLSTTLALVYLGVVVALQAAFRALTGQESQLAVVASTLVMAALFGRLSRSLQDFIDRRFYRKKYDARKTLEAFSAKLRDETDLALLPGWRGRWPLSLWPCS